MNGGTYERRWRRAAKPVSLWITSKGAAMTQTTNRLFDDLSRLMTDAAGAAQGVRREVATAMRAQGERVLADLDVVRRDEFEAVKAMAVAARDDNEQLRQQIATLQEIVNGLRGGGHGP